MVDVIEESCGGGGMVGKGLSRELFVRDLGSQGRTSSKLERMSVIMSSDARLDVTSTPYPVALKRDDVYHLL